MTNLFLATILALAAPAIPAQPSRTGVSIDPCEGLAQLDAAPPSASTAGESMLRSPSQRARLACQLRDVIASRYVFYPVKGELLSRRGARLDQRALDQRADDDRDAPRPAASAGGEGLSAPPRFDARAHLDGCVAAERAIAREEDPLAFYDRMRRCTAAFEDGHLVLGAPVRLPQVALGLSLRLAEGRIYIAGRERKLVSFLESASGPSGLGETLATGNEVVSIDGRPALEEVRSLASYLPASSEGARVERAVDALTRRDFAFPARRSATLVVVTPAGQRTIDLPWWVAPGAADHPATAAYVRRLGLPTTDLLTWRYDPSRDAWARDALATAAQERGLTILPPRDHHALRELLDEDERLAVRMGEVVRRRDRAFCYLQILTFQSETLSGPGGRKPFLAALEPFLRGCREKDLDLVLDLRQNGGGYLAHSSGLFAMLAEPGKSYPGGALVVRANTMNQLIYQQRAPSGAGPARAGDAMDPRHIAESIGAAARARATFSPAFLERPLQASGAGSGFTGRVVALVSPTCMSACDRLAALLQRSGRATLVGGPTEGAGGSQQETRSLPVRWTDPDGVLTLSLPNAAMGVQPALAAAPAGPVVKAAMGQGTAQGAPDAYTGEVPAEEFFQTLTFENRPVVPDVAYATRLDDLTHANRGWLEQAEAALFGQLASGGAVARSSAALHH